MGLIATTTIGTAIAAPTVLNNQNTTHVVNKMLMGSNLATNEAVVVNGNSNMNLYALSNGKGIVSNLSAGEMLTIVGNQQGNYCKVKVQETGAIGYINIANLQNILNGTSDSRIQLSKSGQVINVSNNVRLRSNPSISNNVITNLRNGTQLNILGKQGQWYKVNVNGEIGFIYEEYVSINSGGQLSATLNLSNQATSSNLSANNISSGSNNHVKNIIVRTKSSSNSQISSNAIGSNQGSNIKANINSSSHVKNIIVKAKNNKQSSSHIDNMQIGGILGGENNTNTNKKDITPINKSVKVYVPAGGKYGMGLTPTPSAEKYSYFLPKGVSTVYVISENSSDGLSYIKYNGHYGYVNTILLKGTEHYYLQQINESKQSNSLNVPAVIDNVAGLVKST